MYKCCLWTQHEQQTHQVAVTFSLSGQFLIGAWIINTPGGPVIFMLKPQVTEKKNADLQKPPFILNKHPDDTAGFDT